MADKDPTTHAPTSNEEYSNTRLQADSGPIGDMEESARLKGLQAEVRNQDDLERDIGREADRILLEQANQREQQRLDKTTTLKEKLVAQIRVTRDELVRPIGTSRRAKLRVDIDRMQSQVETLDNDIAEIAQRMAERERGTIMDGKKEDTNAGRQPNETQREFLIRTGKITPFSKLGLSSHGESSATLRGALFDAEEEPEALDMDYADAATEKMSHRNLHRPGFSQQFADESETDALDSDQPRKRRRLERQPIDGENSSSDRYSTFSLSADDSTHVDSDEDANENMPSTEPERRRKARRSKPTVLEDEIEDLRGVDDGNETV